MVWLPEGEKRLRISSQVNQVFSRFDRIPAGDGQTDGHHATAQSALCISSRGKNRYCWLVPVYDSIGAATFFKK